MLIEDDSPDVCHSMQVLMAVHWKPDGSVLPDAQPSAVPALNVEAGALAIAIP